MAIIDELVDLLNELSGVIFLEKFPQTLRGIGSGNEFV